MKINLKKIVIIGFLIIGINAVQIFTFYIMRTSGDITFYDISTHVFFFICAVLSIFSTLLAWRLLKGLNRKQRSIFTIFLGLFFYSILSTIYFVLGRSFNGHKTNWDFIFGNIVFTVITTHIFISAYTVAYLYFVHSHLLEDNVENLEIEKRTLQSNLLKQNLEPHFLFNNLSVLQGLARNSPEKTEDFIENFSEVYRYYLKHNNDDFVAILSEIRFLEQYIELMKSRFGQAYQCDIRIENTEGFVLPCALQLCIENAIKHNAASEELPLLIQIFREKDFLIVRNEIRKIDFTKSNGVGKEYLNRRYEIIFGKKVETIINDTEYIVKIPIISI